jgi:hypothetical protein
MEISQPNLTNIFNSNRKPPTFSVIQKLVDALKLDDEETLELYDIAERVRTAVAPDILDYVMDKELPSVRKAIRAAMSKGLDEKFWSDLLRTIERV